MRRAPKAGARGRAGSAGEKRDLARALPKGGQFWFVILRMPQPSERGILLGCSGSLVSRDSVEALAAVGL